MDDVRKLGDDLRAEVAAMEASRMSAEEELRGERLDKEDVIGKVEE